MKNTVIIVFSFYIIFMDIFNLEIQSQFSKVVWANQTLSRVMSVYRNNFMGCKKESLDDRRAKSSIYRY